MKRGIIGAVRGASRVHFWWGSERRPLCGRQVPKGVRITWVEMEDAHVLCLPCREVWVKYFDALLRREGEEG